ncbi:hypothetical protein [Rossellomorea aquimaris]|uniref:hypothetical protein n=1 Tax=Rossellomorea aquimaris TaxID=189382 RepID=UPI0007D06E5C|nr:hypothetical protein [Rossellomorea aquimaris]
MNFHLSKREWTLFIGLILICVMSLSLLYFFVYSPQNTRLQRIQNELQTEKAILQAMEAKTNVESRAFTDLSLQKKIPVEPLTEQLLLDFEMAEVVSESFIQSMSFEKNDFSQTLSEIEGGNEEDGTASTDVGNSLIKRLQITMTVESPTYFEMERFLTEVENLERIVEVNQLIFTGTEEFNEGVVEGSDQSIIYQIVASAFYLPTLTELKESLPSIDSPPPSLKKNPFNQFTDPAGEEIQNDTED